MSASAALVKAWTLVKDGRRQERFQNLVSEVHKQAWSGEKLETCEEVLKIMKEGAVDKMERYISNNVEDPRQQRLVGRSA